MCNQYTCCKKIALKLTKILKKNTLVIDITTHNKTGSIETEKINLTKLITLRSCNGGPVQAEKDLRRYCWSK